jgi:hypothetical protein
MKAINTKSIPKFWWNNTINKIDTKLRESEITEKNLVKSLKLIGDGKLSTSQGRVIYNDSNFYDYNLHVSGEIVKETFRYNIRISGYRNQWVEGEDLTEYPMKSPYTISALIHLFEKKFVN